MPKKKSKKYNFLTEQKRLQDKKIKNLIDALEKEQKLADVFLEIYAPQFPELYREFQEQLEASVPGCIYIALDKEKATREGMPLNVLFAPKSVFEEILDNFPQEREVKKILDYISAWEQDREQVPLAVRIGYFLKGTTFPVPVSEEIIDSQPVALTSSSEESPEESHSPSSDS